LRGIYVTFDEVGGIVESQNIDEASVIIRRSEWYECGQICTETVGSTYQHDWKGSETGGVREWMDVLLQWPWGVVGWVVCCGDMSVLVAH
jgi:hypothetical protein